MNVLQSASKITLLLLSLTVCVGFLMRILDSKDFMILAIAVFTYYFSYTPSPTITQTDTPPTILK